jgi:hypothetical protein
MRLSRSSDFSDPGGPLGVMKYREDNRVHCIRSCGRRSIRTERLLSLAKKLHEVQKQWTRVLSCLHWNHLTERRSARLRGGPQPRIRRSFSWECAAQVCKENQGLRHNWLPCHIDLGLMDLGIELRTSSILPCCSGVTGEPEVIHGDV